MRSDVAVKKEDGEEGLEAFKKERLLHKRTSSIPFCLQSALHLGRLLKPLLGQTRRNHPLRVKHAQAQKAGTSHAPKLVISLSWQPC